MSDDKRHSSTDCPTSPQRALEENSDIAQEAAELFRPLQVEDSDLRVTSIHQVIHRLYDLEQDQPVDEQADSCKLSPGGEEHNGQNEDSPDAADGKVYRGIERLKALIPTSVRITCECPFSDVVDSMSEYLSHVHQDLGLYVPEPPQMLSAFFSEPEIPLPCRTEDPTVYQLYTQSYVTFGRVSHYEQLLSFHKSYLERWLELLEKLMKQDGPLPPTWRHYIAIMAGSRFHSAYVVSRQKQLFLMEGGDPLWLEGLSEAPPKLKALSELNALLAHRPWKITPEHIEVLVDGGKISATSAVRLDYIPIPTSENSRRRWMKTQLYNKLEEKKKELEEACRGETTKEETINSEVAEIKTLQEAADRLLYDEHHASADLTLEEVRNLQQTVVKPRKHPPASAKPAPLSEHTFPSFRLSQSDTWTMNELTHAIVILVTFHGVASLAHSIGLTLECDLDDSLVINNFEGSDDKEKSGLLHEVSKDSTEGAKSKHQRDLLDKLKTGIIAGDDEYESATERTRAGDGLHSNSPRSTEQQDNPFELAGKAPAVPEYESLAPSDDHKYAYFEKLHGLPLRYRDFNTSEGIFRTQDFSWEQHGFSLMSKFYPLIAPVLDEQFKHTYELTYHTLGGEEGINTMPFRTAVWYYVHRLYGTINDDYNYSNVNRIMKVETKTYIKQLVCSPETITQRTFDNIEGNLGPDEKCHVGLLSIEAKKQAALLYALHAMMKYFT